MLTCSLVSELGVPKEPLENLRWRVELLDRCRDLSYRAVVREAVWRDPIFFVNAFCVTFDPRLPNEKYVPFCTYPHEDEYILAVNAAIEAGEDLLTEKSRDMGGTWCILAVMLWRWLTRDDTFLLGSRLQELVDKAGDMQTHFERIRCMLDYLPDWLLPVGFNRAEHDTRLKLFNPAGGNAIVGAAMTKDFGRQGRFKAVLFDEFAFCEDPAGAWQACADTTPCRLPISTPSPQGTANFFAMLRLGGKIKVYTLHWRMHPLKTQAWYDKEKLRRRPEEVARELDIDYEGSAIFAVMIPSAWARAAQQQPEQRGPNFCLVVCDPARFGDDVIVIDVIRGFKLYRKERYTKHDTTFTRGRIKALVEEEHADSAVVDVIGIGAGIVDGLAEDGVPVIGVNAGEAASDPARYGCLRDEMWDLAADVYRDGLASDPPDDILLQDLAAPKRSYTSSGRLKVEGKDEIKPRLNRSTDDGDTRVMGIWAMKGFQALRDQQEQEARAQNTVTGEDIGLGGHVDIGQSI